ncbi:hypothetical protein [Scytonema sp. PCC 10023]
MGEQALREGFQRQLPTAGDPEVCPEGNQRPTGEPVPYGGKPADD